MGRVAFVEALAGLADLRIDVARGVRVPSAVNRGWRRLPAAM